MSGPRTITKISNKTATNATERQEILSQNTKKCNTSLITNTRIINTHKGVKHSKFHNTTNFPHEQKLHTI